MKLQRLIAILTVLLRRDRVSAAVLSEKFGVSVRTIYRDMQALEQAGIPIVTHPGKGGGFAIIEQYKIDKKLFTHQDITTLLTGLYSVSGPISDAKVNQTIEKIKGLIPTEYGKSIELTSKQLYIDMTPWAVNPLIAETLEKIRQALEESRLIGFEYTARCSVPQGRIVEPHQLVLKENSWYLRAWCRQRGDFRTFKIGRMRDLRLLAQQFAPRDFGSRLDDFKDWESERTIYVDLLVDRSLRERLLDFCREEYLRDLEDGRIAVHMPFVESAMGYGVLLGLGHSCEIVGPSHIRDEFVRRIDLLKAVYSQRA